MPALPPNTCPSGYGWYTCDSSGFEGCCTTDACDYSDGCPQDDQFPGMICGLNVIEPRLITSVAPPSIPVVTVTRTSTITSSTETSTSSAAASSSTSFSTSIVSSTAAASTTSNLAASSATSATEPTPSISSAIGIVPPTNTSRPSSSSTAPFVGTPTSPSSPNSTSTPHVGPPLPARDIGGIVAGGMVFLLLLLLLIHWLRRGCCKKLANCGRSSGGLPTWRRLFGLPAQFPSTATGTGTFRLSVLNRRSTQPANNATVSGQGVVSPLSQYPNANSADPSSFVVSPITTAPDSDPDPVPMLDSTPIEMNQHDLLGGPMSPVGKIPELPGNSAILAVPELPEDNFAHPLRSDSGMTNRILRSDPTRPHVASWQNYEETPEWERAAEGPYTGPNLADES